MFDPQLLELLGTDQEDWPWWGYVTGIGFNASHLQLALSDSYLGILCKFSATTLVPCPPVYFHVPCHDNHVLGL